MCGIVAIADQNSPVPPARIDAMRAAIFHRGPDAGGTLARRNDAFAVGLGAQRLSILDLSPAGAMPMPNENERVWIAYNGEIYNHRDLRAELERRGHRYRSGADTETVLHAYEEYGVDCFAMFNGMFACAIYDEPRRRLVIARDRTGVKPLYYAEQPGRLLCASELKALLHTGQVPATIDQTALEVYLALGYVPAPHSLIAGVRKLPAGAYGVFEDGRLAITRYWQPTASITPAARSWPETVAATRAAVAGAVERQMMSDVPVGVMLSGGLDSTIVATVASASSSERLHTFSIGFATGQSELEPIYNYDRDFARQVAASLGTDHHEIVAHDDAALADTLQSLVEQLDEPVWEPSFLSIYLISTLAREHGVKVLLSGDGSDELFAGYGWHPALMRLEQIERLPGLRPLLSLLARAPLPGMTAAKFADLRRKYRAPDVAKYHAQYDVFDAATRARMVGRESGGDPVDALVGPLLASCASAPLSSRFAVAELCLWVGEHFNQRLDRMAMAASVEGRVPFQDNAVVDLALAMPMADKLHGGVSKAPLRAAFADHIPAAVARRVKRPFAAPATAWMEGALRPLVLERLAPDALARLPGIDPATAGSVWSAFRDNRPVRQERIWTLLGFALWAESFGVAASGSARPMDQLEPAPIT